MVRAIGVRGRGSMLMNTVDYKSAVRLCYR